MNGVRCLKFVSFDVSQGWTRPLVAKYFTQPTYGRKRSGLRPAWNFARASASFVIMVNCGLLFGYCFTYCANIGWPPSFPYPAQSSTCSAPLSVTNAERAASAADAGPATRPAPPTSAPAFMAPLRETLRRTTSSCVSISRLLSTCLVTRWADHEEDLGGLRAGITHPVGSRAPVVDAVTGTKVVDLLAQLDVRAAA